MGNRVKGGLESDRRMGDGERRGRRSGRKGVRGRGIEKC
jgi:hypothetical protein